MTTTQVPLRWYGEDTRDNGTFHRSGQYVIAYDGSALSWALYSSTWRVPSFHGSWQKAARAAQDHADTMAAAAARQTPMFSDAPAIHQAQDITDWTEDERLDYFNETEDLLLEERETAISTHTILAQIREAKAMRDRAEAMIAQHVGQAAERGISWAEIGTTLGITRQGARQRYSPKRADGAPQDETLL